MDNFRVSLFGFLISSSSRTLIFSGMLLATPLKTQVPVGRVGIDSSVTLSIIGRRHPKAVLERGAERRRTVVADGASDFTHALALGQQR